IRGGSDEADPIVGPLSLGGCDHAGENPANLAQIQGCARSLQEPGQGFIASITLLANRHVRAVPSTFAANYGRYALRGCLDTLICASRIAAMQHNPCLFGSFVAILQLVTAVGNGSAAATR